MTAPERLEVWKLPLAVVTGEQTLNLPRGWKPLHMEVQADAEGRRKPML